MSLHRRGDEWSIRIHGVELMNSRRSGSERALAERAAQRIPSAKRVLIGGLGMGYTLAAALACFAKADVVSAEISPAVIRWNRGVLSELAGDPLADPRASIFSGDVAELLRAAGTKTSVQRFDAILLDLDNGPEALTRAVNATLYTPAGIEMSIQALQPGGVLAYWSASPSPAFERKLRRQGCDIESERLSPRGGGRGGARHTLWWVRRD